MKPNSPITLEISPEDPLVAYVNLPDHPKETVPGIVNRSIDLCDLIEGYRGPQVILDFDAQARLIGIEILG